MSLNFKVPRFVEYLVLTAFIGFYLYFKFNYHELWKDEWQAWLMARDMGWGELLGSLYYEGHPALWYLYLKVWALFSTGVNDPFLLQTAHAAVMIGVYYLLFFRLKFPFWVKTLLLFSYYPFFEYGMVSRGYAFVMLIGFAIVTLLDKPEKNWKWLAALFFLFCQTEVYAVMMAGALLFYLFLENGFLKNWKALFKKGTFRNLAISGLAGLIVFIISVFPRGSGEELSRAYLSEPFSSETLFKGFQGMFANTFWIGSIPDTNIFGVSSFGLLLSILVLAGLIFFFRKEKNLLWTLLFFVVGYFVFLITIYTGGVRQWGTFFIFFVMLLSLYFSKNTKSVGSTPSIDSNAKTGANAQASRGTTLSHATTVIGLVFLCSILFFQIRYTTLAVKKEYNHPFTNAQITADFIKEKVPKNVPIVAINKFEAAPVVGYANRKFYTLPEGELFSYFKWVEKIYLPSELELKMFAEYKKVGGIVIITPKKLDPNRYPTVQLWKSFDSYNLKKENYHLYSLKR